jgi:1-deoxy-D-xylulose-5-phosphate synthase
VRLKIIGLPDKFVEHGSVAILRELHGLSSAHVKEVVRELVRPGTHSPIAAHGAGTVTPSGGKGGE